MATFNSSHENSAHLNASDISANNPPGRFRLANRKQLSVRLLTGEDLLLLYDVSKIFVAFNNLLVF